MPDLLVVGRIYTMDPALPVAEAVLIRQGRFAQVGSAVQCDAQARPGAARIDLGPGSATAGLADAHGHVFWHGRSKLEVSCAGLRDEARCIERVAAQASRTPPGRWIRGRGWDQNLWPGQRFPTEASLERATAAHPVALERVDGHALWVNARALDVAGIRQDTPDPEGGRILRYLDGRPSGVLVDQAAELVLGKIPPSSPAEIEEAVLLALKDLVQAGLTAVHDAGVGPEGLEVYRRLAAEDRLPLRVYAMIHGPAPREMLRQQMALWKQTPEVGRLTVRAVKIFADGALGSRGAALFEPYGDDPGNLGLLLTPIEELRERIAMVAQAGLQPAVHAIGDRACSEVARAFASAAGAAGPGRWRPRIEHVQIAAEADLQLLAGSGAVASMQPIHAVSDAPWAEERLGRSTPRLRGAYAWRRVLESGMPLAFGSDFPVDDLDPRLGLQAAELRMPRGASSPWMPEQRLSRTEALRAYTEGAAVAALAEHRRGKVKAGYDADLTAFADDIHAVPAMALPDIQVTHTIVAGRIEHAAGS